MYYQLPILLSKLAWTFAVPTSNNTMSSLEKTWPSRLGVGALTGDDCHGNLVGTPDPELKRNSKGFVYRFLPCHVQYGDQLRH